ncbi:WLM-domain-containing protein [Myriangium duriaei CBS 260.36]|uniref:WLM-domain-containing protein n=1 Tax=Myriangium duriaei CBS 260.36 TaxID=1168546 RepID=A0A9P4MQ64_9PEZI|nr:WLM-domain-containing protein [Myriangium duriaei CBS 260.36]
MKAHHLSVTTLEEFPPNREFLGRNFNNGEVIQLVLRRMPTRGQSSSGVKVTGNAGRIDPHASNFISEDDDGGWLSLRSVQMVMMHELAHCMHMNHGKGFWAVRNEYAAHLEVLWSRRYTGEGMWGRGQGLESGQFETGAAPGAGEFEDVCGGAYRGRRKRGRKDREKVSYAERKKRKLEKTEAKFGKGQGLGEEEHAKVLYEGKFVAAKPRVANSKRGRELRAAAALARFDQAMVEKEKKEAIVVKNESGSETESETESEHGEELLDYSGRHVKDAAGNSLYRVQDDEDKGSSKNELDELIGLTGKARITNDDITENSTATDNPQSSGPAKDQEKRPPNKPQPKSRGTTDTTGRTTKSEASSQNSRLSSTSNLDNSSSSSLSSPSTSAAENRTKTIVTPQEVSCSVCTLLNSPHSSTCQACGNALPSATKSTNSTVYVYGGTWFCTNSDCQRVGYLNPNDAGRCGLCGAARS